MTLDKNNLIDAIASIEQHINDAKVGLPFEVFEFISRLTPLVNVDLLIKDKHNRVLLAWRDDAFAGKGWHIPGGIVRFKETLDNRIQQVAHREIGRQVIFNPKPLAINQFICGHETRGHFISLLYDCEIDDDFHPCNVGRKPTEPGYLAWHSHCPDNLVKVHDVYAEYICNPSNKTR
jgi:colanic acid biosynthesis protein WcaH